MKLRTKYLLFIFIVHAATLLLSFIVFQKDKPLFFVAEAVVLFSLWLAWSLYKQLLQPLNTLMSGVEAIKDQDFSVKFLPTGKTEMDSLIGVYNSMMDRLREEKTKQEQQHFFLAKLIVTAPTGIVILDYNRCIAALNPKAEQMLGLREQMVQGKSIEAITHPVLQQVSRMSVGQARTVLVNGTQTYRLQLSHFMDRGFAREFVTIEELTAEILAAEEKVYGKIIRMMAHEVNNTVGPVNSILQSSLKHGALAGAEALHNALHVAIHRNNNLNVFMRNFADLVKLPQPTLRRLDLHMLLRNVAALMAHKAGEQAIELLFEMDEAPFLIEADEQQMEQALINIVKNAVEAIGQGGTIIFRTQSSKGLLEIVDSGKGISAEEAEQLFTPFYSTKKDGQGIGLMLVRDILRNHGFDFSLKTRAAGATVFAVRFG